MVLMWGGLAGWRCAAAEPPPPPMQSLRVPGGGVSDEVQYALECCMEQPK
jgi:hypothetical protein